MTIDFPELELILLQELLLPFMEDVPSTSTASSTLRHTPDLAVAGDGHTSTRSQTVSLDKLNGVKNGSISGNTVLGQLFGNPFFTAVSLGKFWLIINPKGNVVDHVFVVGIIIYLPPI